MERIDELKNGRKIIQDPKKFCFGCDAVLLSDFTTDGVLSRPKGRGLNVCDLGCGNGIIPILLEKNFSEKNIALSKIFGIEIQSDVAEMAKKSVELNGLTEKIEIIEGDLKNAFSFLEKNTFDVVTSNPPYIVVKDGRNCKSDNMKIARHEVLCNLNDVVEAAAGLLNSRGKFFMIHKPFRLVEIFDVLTKNKLEPKRVQFIHSPASAEPTMVLIESEKSGKSRVAIELKSLQPCT